MQRLFGMPIGGLAVALGLLAGLCVAVVVTLALRNLVFFRLGVRNVKRRPGRSALIVVGLMLATAIIAAALGTGDTMGRTVRSSTLRALGTSDEWVTVKGAKPDLTGGVAAASSVMPPFDERVVTEVQAALHGTKLVDGITPAIIRTVGVQDVRSRQTEPRVTIFAPDASHMAGFGVITGSSGRAVRLDSLTPGDAYLNRRAASALGARRGDRVAMLAGDRLLSVRVADIVDYRGAGTAKYAVLMPLAHVQTPLGLPGQVEEILVSNRGSETSGVASTSAVISRLRPVLA